MKKLRVNWKKVATVCLDVVLAVYLVAAVTAFNKPDETSKVCTKVSIDIEDEATNGFISKYEVKNRLDHSHLYPLSKPMRYVDARQIEETLQQSPFVKKAECYKTQDGQVFISLTQRMPIVRIKAISGDDYYMDDNNSVMPNSSYTSDLIIATGYITRHFASCYIAPLAKAINASDLWRNQIVQVNVTPDHSIELVPRVGEQVINIGRLPVSKYKSEREKLIPAFVNKQLTRLMKFYQYGLSQAGWNKYSYIDLEFTNQIICKKKQAIQVE